MDCGRSHMDHYAESRYRTFPFNAGRDSRVYFQINIFGRLSKNKVLRF